LVQLGGDHAWQQLVQQQQQEHIHASHMFSCTYLGHAQQAARFAAITAFDGSPPRFAMPEVPEHAIRQMETAGTITGSPVLCMCVVCMCVVCMCVVCMCSS
jgi:hypothetical protein